MIKSIPKSGVFRLGIIPADFFDPTSVNAIIPDGLIATIEFDVTSDATGNIVLKNSPGARHPLAQTPL